MLRGKRTFICDNCGHKFEGFDIEWNCTAFSAPLKCPKCGSFHTYPYSSSEGFFEGSSEGEVISPCMKIYGK